VKGLRIIKNGDCLEEVSKNNTKVKLLARAGEMEVMLQTIKADQPFTLTPWSGSEFFYILDGSLVCTIDGEETVLGPGDYLQATQLVQPAYFRTVNKLTILYLASPPVFSYISDTIRQWQDLATDIELKDMYTEEHCQRIQKIATRIGERLRLSGGQMQRLIDSAYLHDLGKTVVPEEVLAKPGRLSQEEWEHIRRHPTAGRQMLEDTFLEEVGQVIEQHHEREDGLGYPLGLTGREISIEAKIIAVADAFDAMTSDRPYRKAMSTEQALAELVRLKGQQFSPEVVDAFMEIVAEDGQWPPAEE
jgi:HD-GYP domain-containing protein (c-di-GMP phosphodiesterase class II)